MFWPSQLQQHWKNSVTLSHGSSQKQHKRQQGPPDTNMQSPRMMSGFDKKTFVIWCSTSALMPYSPYCTKNILFMYKLCLNELQHGKRKYRQMQSLKKHTSAMHYIRNKTSKYVHTRMQTHIHMEKLPLRILIIHTGS